MIRLILFELAKIWKKRSTLISVLLLLILNLFLLWYTNLSDGNRPELSAYRDIQADLAGMTETEKLEYVERLYDTIQNICLVRDILAYQSWGTDMGDQLARQEQAAHPGILEEYRDAFTEGSYLIYTGSLEQETSLISEIYEEITKVASYSDYLSGIQEQKDSLGSISIFAGDENSFSSRNIKKSAEDYAGLSNTRIEFRPSKGIVSASQNSITDVLLILAVLIVAGGLICEEKEKGLFHITRTTVLGRGHSIAARLLALCISVLIITFLMYGLNLLFFSVTTGTGNLLSSIQSAAPLMESSLSVNFLTYILLCVLTKAWILFLTGTWIVFLSILSKHSFLPYLVCCGCIMTCLLLYWLIPPYSSLNWLKYLNPAGLMNTDHLYGEYLNLNFFGYPVSRLAAALVVLLLYLAVLTAATVMAFIRCRNWEVRKLRFPVLFSFRPHSSLARHEAYKLLIMNRGCIVLLAFSVLIAWRCFSTQYDLTPAETYYQNIMLQLEGPLTREKTELINAEKELYDTAFSQIERIDSMIASSEISADAGDSMKLPYYDTLAFYPAFQRVLSQYDAVREAGGSFVYDTGWLYLFDVNEADSLINLILLTLCILLGFSNGMAMEHQKQSWHLLSASFLGRVQVKRSKVLISMIYAFLISVVPWICRMIQINHTYPLRGGLALLKTIPAYLETGLTVPVILWLVIGMLVQSLVLIAMALITLFLSDQLRIHLPALSVSSLILLIPLVLNAMGLTPAVWFSFLPLYEISCFVRKEHGLLICSGYLLAAAGGIGILVYLLGTDKTKRITRKWSN